MLESQLFKVSPLTLESCKAIVIIRNSLGNPANFKGTNKDQTIFVGRSTILHNLSFFFLYSHPLAELPNRHVSIG